MLKKKCGVSKNPSLILFITVSSVLIRFYCSNSLVVMYSWGQKCIRSLKAKTVCREPQNCKQTIKLRTAFGSK